MDIITNAQKKTAANNLLRIHADSMTPAELNLACALILRLNIRSAQASENSEESESLQVQAGQHFVEFSPMTDWNDLGEVLTGVGLVTGSHESFDENGQADGYRFSCHAYFSSCQAEGNDMPTVIGVTVAKLLAHNLRFSEVWKAD